MEGHTEDCCDPDAQLDALDELVANECVACIECGHPLHYWLQPSNRGVRDNYGTLIGLEAYDLVMCHCINPDCPLMECTTTPQSYHSHMALFLDVQS